MMIDLLGLRTSSVAAAAQGDLLVLKRYSQTPYVLIALGGPPADPARRRVLCLNALLRNGATGQLTLFWQGDDVAVNLGSDWAVRPDYNFVDAPDRYDGLDGAAMVFNGDGLHFRAMEGERGLNMSFVYVRLSDCVEVQLTGSDLHPVRSYSLFRNETAYDAGEEPLVVAGDPG